MDPPRIDDDEIVATAEFLKEFMPEAWPFEAVRFSVSTPLWLRQAVRLTDELGNVTALLSWAFVDDALHRQFLTGKERILHPPEWNEGLHTWLIHGFYVSALPPAPFRHKVKVLVQAYGPVHWLWDDGTELRVCRAETCGSRVLRLPVEPDHA